MTLFPFFPFNNIFLIIALMICTYRGWIWALDSIHFSFFSFLSFFKMSMFSWGTCLIRVLVTNTFMVLLFYVIVLCVFTHSQVMWLRLLHMHWSDWLIIGHVWTWNATRIPLPGPSIGASLIRSDEITENMLEKGH